MVAPFGVFNSLFLIVVVCVVEKFPAKSRAANRTPQPQLTANRSDAVRLVGAKREFYRAGDIWRNVRFASVSSKPLLRRFFSFISSGQPTLPGLMSADDGEQECRFLSGVLKAAHDMDRDRNHVVLLENDFSLSRPSVPRRGPSDRLKRA